MRVIEAFWFPRNSDHVNVPLNESAKIIHVGVQGGLICIWFEVDQAKPFVAKNLTTGHGSWPRSFFVLATGETISERG